MLLVRQTHRCGQSCANDTPRGPFNILAGVHFLVNAVRELREQNWHRLLLPQIFGRRYVALLVGLVCAFFLLSRGYLMLLTYLLENNVIYFDGFQRILFGVVPTFLLSNYHVLTLLSGIQVAQFLRSDFYRENLLQTPLHKSILCPLIGTFALVFTGYWLLDELLWFLWILIVRKGDFTSTVLAQFPAFELAEYYPPAVPLIAELLGQLSGIIRIFAQTLFLVPIIALVRRPVLVLPVYIVAVSIFSIPSMLLMYPMNLIMSLASGYIGYGLLHYFLIALLSLICWIIATGVLVNFWQKRWHRHARS